MKIGILTHYNVYNHGAQLQMLCLKQWLEENGHRVSILTYEKNFDFDRTELQKNSASVRNISYYLKTYLLDRGIGLTVFNVRKVLSFRKQLNMLPMAPYDRNDCDVVIVGSDEVFSIDVGCNRMMYGHGLMQPVVAYAPSFGRATEEDLHRFDCYGLIQSGLRDMYALSARDLHTQQLIRSLTGREAPLVCDPVILYRGAGLRVPVRTIKRPFLLVYSYSRHMTDSQEITAIRDYAKKHGLLTVSLGNYHGWCDKNVVCNAKEWFSWFQSAHAVVTDTFHGAVVAMKNRCNLAVAFRPAINGFKMESLLTETGLTERKLATVSVSELERVLSAPIDYSGVEQRLAGMADKGEQYLKTALESAYEQCCH